MFVKSVGEISILAVRTQSLLKKSPQPTESAGKPRSLQKARENPAAHRKRGKTLASQTKRLEDVAQVFLKDRELKTTLMCL